MTPDEFRKYYESVGYRVTEECDDSGRWALCAYDEDDVMIDWCWL